MYDYKKEKPKLFTEEGFKLLTKIRDNSIRLQKITGAFTLEALISGAGISGDTFQMVAAVDYLVEQGELILVERAVPSQHSIYKRG